MKRTIDAKIRIVGNSFVITVPINIIKKFNLKKGDFIESTFKLSKENT